MSSTLVKVASSLATNFNEHKLYCDIRGVHLQHKDVPIISPWKNDSGNAFSGAAFSFHTGHGPYATHEILDWSTYTRTTYKNSKPVLQKLQELIDSGNYYFTRNVYLASWPEGKELTAENWAQEFVDRAIAEYGN